MMKANSILMTALLLLSSLQDAGAFVPNNTPPVAGSSTTTTTTTTTTGPLFVTTRDPQSMRVAEIKAELKQLRVGFGDCFDKESLVTRLKFARSNPPPPPPPPPSPAPPSSTSQRTNRPRPSSFHNRVEFGAESDMNSDIPMDVFAQAGWTGEERRKGNMSPVDHDRSPGLNRNFDELSLDDFKQAYRG